MASSASKNIIYGTGDAITRPYKCVSRSTIKKMRIIEASIRKDDKSWACMDGES
jgi:hypothetical protein